MAATDLAGRVRRFLQPHWETWHRERGLDPVVRSQWTCGRSSLFLTRVLLSAGFDCAWATGCPFDDAGRPIAAGYYFEGEWRGHSWVETPTLIIDITADQFGLAPVTVLPVRDERYRRSADFAFAEAKAMRVETVEGLWSAWQGLAGAT